MGYNTISLAIIVVSKTLESYSRGRRGGPAKALVRETVARVRIPDSPPRESHTKHLEISVSYFFLHDCFGIVINFELPKIDNPSHLNWLKQKEMSLVTFVNRDL